MDQLDRDAGFYRPVVTTRPELSGEEGEKGTEPLATREQEVLGDLGEVDVVGGRCLEETLLDPG